MKKFKDILREKRKALGMSQFELGIEVGTTQAKIWHWESGTCYPNFTSLNKLADVLECSVDELMGRTK
jgi:transcriptional regulator with XRE-family HTH domain